MLRSLTLGGPEFDELRASPDVLNLLRSLKSSVIESLNLISIRGGGPGELEQLISDIASCGYLESCDEIRSVAGKERMEVNKKMHAIARSVCRVLLCLRRFRKTCLSRFQYDIVKMIARNVFMTRADEGWRKAFEDSEIKHKKI